MEIVFFVIWGICTLSCVLIIPIGIKMESLSDDNRLKKWWMKHIVDLVPNKKNSI